MNKKLENISNSTRRLLFTKTWTYHDHSKFNSLSYKKFLCGYILSFLTSFCRPDYMINGSRMDFTSSGSAKWTPKTIALNLLNPKLKLWHFRKWEAPSLLPFVDISSHLLPFWAKFSLKSTPQNLIPVLWNIETGTSLNFIKLCGIEIHSISFGIFDASITKYLNFNIRRINEVCQKYC